jgi:hypothetical protein
VFLADGGSSQEGPFWLTEEVAALPWNLV